MKKLFAIALILCVCLCMLVACELDGLEPNSPSQTPNNPSQNPQNPNNPNNPSQTPTNPDNPSQGTPSNPDNQPEQPGGTKVTGEISDIQDLSKVYDGTPVGNPTYTTNNLFGTVTVTFYQQGGTTPIAPPANAGNYTVKVSIAADATTSAVEGSANFTIHKATAAYTVPQQLTAASGSKLSALDISRYGLAWVNPETVVEASGQYPAKVSVDEANYLPDSTVVQIFVNVVDGFEITCVSGSANCYTVSQNNGETVITFAGITEKSVYSLRGFVYGGIVIDVGDDCKFELELCGATITSTQSAPIVVLSGDKVTLTAKNGTENFVNDNRAAAASEEISSAVYALSDLVVGGKGSLFVESQNNNGIHTKDDLEVKNLTLQVKCADNALKGNDSVTISGGNLTLIATQGDGIKTSNSDVSSKGNQRGTVAVLGGETTIYAACDGIDAAYNVEISGGVLKIFTDRYSEYSQEVTAVSGGTYYISYSSQNYQYSVKYYNSETDFVWKNATYYTSKQSGGRPGQGSAKYYYKVEKPSGYSQMAVYVYSSSQQQGQEQNFVASGTMTVNNSYDTLAISNLSTFRYNWTNYATASTGGWGGPGGMQDGNSDKGDHSTKGLKADNEIVISAGTVEIKSYDDGIHANSDSTIQSTNAQGLGKVTVSGGDVTVYSNDDGIHADSTLTICGGNVSVVNSYEGLEGTVVRIEGGNVSVVSKDDGVNGTATTGESIVICGGSLYVYASGDGLDSNSRTSYDGILFAGGHTVVVQAGGGNSPIDTESGYKYTGGYVVAIGSNNGMWNESIKCSNFSSVGCYKSNVASAAYVTVSGIATVKMPQTFTSVVIVLGTNSATIATGASTSDTLDNNGVCWKV